MGKNYKALTQRELRNLLESTMDIVDNLPDIALNELLEGGDGDIDNLIEDMMHAAYSIINCNDTFKPEFKGLSEFTDSFDDGMKRLSYNYFKTTMLPNFNQGWRNIEWGNIIQLYPWCVILASRGHGKSYEGCFSFPLWRMWRHRRPNFLQKETIDNKNSKETVIITNESKLARKHMKLISEEIRMNDMLIDMRPDSLSLLGIDKITVKSGATLEFRTFGGFIRGLHVGAVCVDDFLDESCLYSKEQRDKFHEIFYGAIKSIVEPYGHLLVTGTPYHDSDLYQELKEDQMFKVFEYPAIFPDGSLLAPERGFDFEHLMNIKRSLGSLVFSREYLVSPVTDNSTIFPYDYLRKSFIGMENVSYVNNIESFPIKTKRVVIGCDFAISGNIGADYSVFTVWGKDSDGKYYLMHVWRKQGASHREQVDVICRLNQMFKANKIVAESNGFQSILSDLVRERGVKNIEEFTTTSKVKKNSYEGLPSISAMFERGEIKLPYKEGESKETTNWLCGEFNSITYLEDSGKLESAGATDDGVMSSFFALSDLREKKQLKVHYI